MKRTALLGGAVLLALAGLALAQGAPAAKKDDNGGATYIGVKKCKMCHMSQYHTWLKMKHSHAIDALSPAEQKKPECVKCHVTGYGQPGGFVSMEKTPDMANVQCEACHGPGSNHLKASMKDKKNTILPRGKDCRDCHQPHIDVNRKKMAAADKK